MTHILDEKRIFRIVDANFNRAKEGLRVCEDLCRFFLNDQKKTSAYKTIRHHLSAAVRSWPIESLIRSRNIEQDIGKKSFPSELKRQTLLDIFYANSQRIKESLRVMEELMKLRSKRGARAFKSMRYQIYGLEKKIIERL